MGRGRGRRAGELRIDTVPARLRTKGDPSATIDANAGSLAGLLELVERDEQSGLGDGAWPPQFPKQPGEPKRVQPSRAKPECRRSPGLVQRDLPRELGLHLVEQAVARGFVVAPAQQFGSMADAAAARLVEADLDDELGP